MPFLAPLVPALVGGAASAAGGAAVNAVSGALNGAGKGNPQAIATPNAVSTGDTQNAIANSNQALNSQTQLAQQLAAQGGIQNQSSVFNQLQGVANGQGPNPAQAMLAQATGQNVANQAALMAGQRGAGANVGLLARQAAQQGGALQQNAAGQGAVMQANQSLNALGQLGGIAGQQVAQQQQAVGQQNQFAQNQQQQMLGQLQAQNQLAVGQQQGQNSINAANQQQQNAMQQDLTKGVASGLGSATAALVAPKPGVPVQAKAQGGEIASLPMMKENYKGKSRIGSHLMSGIKMKTGGNVPGVAPISGTKDTSKNDVVPAMLSPGEIVLPRSVTQSADPALAAAQFVAALKSKKGKR